MSGIVLIGLIICGSFTITVLGCVWMGISYQEKKRGYRHGASQREITDLQEQVSILRDETVTIKKQMRELIQIAKGISE